MTANGSSTSADARRADEQARSQREAKAKKVTSEERTAPLPEAWRLPPGLEGRAVCAVDLVAQAEKAPAFVVDRLVEAGDVMLITGQEKVALKTWLALDLALARILGREWLGFGVPKGRPKRVLFVSTETRGTVLVRRLLAACGPSVDPVVAAKYLHIIDEPVTMVSRAERDRVRSRASGRAHLTAMATHDAERREKLMRSIEGAADWAEGNLGQNIDLLDAIATPDTWSLIIVDTVRQCLDGDESSSRDAARFIAAVRELARDAGCVVAVVHHTNKAGAHGDARSARGSGELTAGPDCLCTIDASGEYPTMHFLVRNHESPGPVGYALAKTDDGVRLDVRPPCAGGKTEIAGDDVLAVFEAHADDGLTVSTLRKLIAQARGAKEGSKANAKQVQKHLDALVGRGLISACEIVDGKKTMAGYRLGPGGGKLPTKKIDPDAAKAGLDSWLGGADDV